MSPLDAQAAQFLLVENQTHTDELSQSGSAYVSGTRVEVDDLRVF